MHSLETELFFMFHAKFASLSCRVLFEEELEDTFNICQIIHHACLPYYPETIQSCNPRLIAEPFRNIEIISSLETANDKSRKLRGQGLLIISYNTLT